MLRRKFLQLGTAGLGLTLAGQTWATNIQPGRDYRNVRQVQSIAPHKKQVLEFFYYGCSHCYNLEPSLHEWLKTKPSDVNFQRIPAVLDNPNWQFMAKVYLTAEDLGIVDQSHMPFFHALHRDRLPLFNLQAIAQFHSQFGVSEQTFAQTFESFKIDQAMRRAQQLTQTYHVQGVPNMIINGRYVTDLTMTGSPQALWKTVDQLLTL